MLEIKNIEKEEVVNTMNQIIASQINYINGLCFVYSNLKEKYNNVFNEDLKALFVELKKLSVMKKGIEEHLEGNENLIKPLSLLQIDFENVIDKNLDNTINNIVEQNEVNKIFVERKI